MRNKKLIILFSVLLGITLLAVCNSVLFSVQHVNAYCANREESAYRQEVLASHKIKRGTSIFLVNKDKVVKNVQTNVPHVRVLNIEKKFPNRIWINYIEETEYLKITQGNKTLYLSRELRVMSVIDGVWEGDAIRLLYNGEPPALSVGDTLSFDGSQTVDGILAGFADLGYDDTTVDLLYEIDLRGEEILLTLAYKTATGKTPGMQWRILTADRLSEKIRLALSVYDSDKLTDEQKKRGTLIVAGDKVTYQGVGGGVTDVTPA